MSSSKKSFLFHIRLIIIQYTKKKFLTQKNNVIDIKIVNYKTNLKSTTIMIIMMTVGLCFDSH